ncbi:phosphoribosyl-AMP cyclohydrolase [Thermogutta sp.]|jgi:phosphoribosyl-AMP cyclohydrolase|uniref:phosphoribosyl-AMP cyclohydrolase n=1 Tax=Thermogutta sp. TaxID=1962930 RepID=UPI00321F84D2
MSDKTPTSAESSPQPGPDFSRGGGILPAIAQDAATGEVLMLAYMNAESFAETVATGRAVYFSRSRNKLWRKGEESGHVQIVKEIFIDCDNDAILLKVEQVGGAACHTGYRSCFYRQFTPTGLIPVGEPVFDPKKVYGQKS